jgi:hypothetical protein
MCHPIPGQVKDEGKNVINDGQRENQESCQILRRNVENRKQFCDLSVRVRSIKIANFKLQAMRINSVHV